jgi:sugar phosphate isomerase/epimerase
VNVGLLTDALSDRPLEAALAWCAERRITAVELGVGGYSSSPHADLSRLLAHRSARDVLLGATSAAGTALVALNVSGNPLHPSERVAAEHDRALRGAIELARTLGVPRVVAMSGCPGGPGGGAWPIFAGGAWLPDMQGLWDWQWRERIEPYWRALSRWARAAAPEVAVCLELHPGTSNYNAESFHRLRAVTGANVLVNLDPSHFWWQGIDPVQTIAELEGQIGFAHGKDTLRNPAQIARHGLLDFRWPGDPDSAPWHFAAVGSARPTAEWTDVLGALRRAGYDDVVSIEHEDPRFQPEAGIELALSGLGAALESLGAGDHAIGLADRGSARGQ